MGVLKVKWKQAHTEEGLCESRPEGAGLQKDSGLPPKGLWPGCPLKVFNHFPSDKQYHILVLRVAWKE